MAYSINDKNLIEELCGDDFKTVIDYEKNQLVNDNNPNFVHPLDDQIVGEQGILSKLLNGNTTFSYASADKLDDLWRILLDKSIRCLRYFDNREPFKANDRKSIVAYGIDNLEDYHRKYTEFESLMYGASTYYRDHVFHAVRVWMLGVFCLIKKDFCSMNFCFLILIFLNTIITNWHFLQL